MQSKAGSANLTLAELQARIKGLRMDSESAKERSESGPGREEDESGESGVELSGRVFWESLSRRDLHWWVSLEWALRQEADLMILSRVGMRIWFRREVASGGEAISR